MMKRLIYTMLLATTLGALGCGSSSNGPVDPAQASEEDRRRFKAEEKRIEDLERANRKMQK